MKFLITSLVFTLFNLTCFSQPEKFTGSWYGTLNVGIELKIVFHITQTENGSFVSTADSPDQSAFGLKCDTTFIKNDEIKIEMKMMGASYSGKLINDSVISGIFFQRIDIPLTLTKKLNPTTAIRKRPQTPQPPFAYKSEEISYTNKEKSIQFGATITIPSGKGPFPAIVLISGSGPQNRNCEILGHQLFSVLANQLTNKGFVVLRYDERGIGKSTGRFSNATTADFANDASAGVDYLLSRTEVDKDKIGLIGHSEGGIVAPMIAAQRSDINFLVLLAAPGIPILTMMAEQNEAIAQKNGAGEVAAKEFSLLFRRVIPTISSAKDSLSALQASAELIENWSSSKDKGLLSALNLETAKKRFEYVAALVPQVRTKWFQYFLTITPSVYLEQLTCKVLALNGDKDIQVISSSNLDGIKKALKNSKVKKYEIKKLNGLNHLFQHCTTCTVNEYAEIEETISTDALLVISNWLDKNIK